MQIREWINNNSAAVTIGAVALLVVALAIMFAQVSGGGAAQAGDVWYQAIENGQPVGEPFTGDPKLLPPITDENGREAVRVYIFSCGDCDNPSEQIIGYYEKYHEKAKQILEQQPDSMEAFNAMTQGRLISKDGKKWVPAESMPGFQIQDSVRCPDGSVQGLQLCKP